MNVKGSTIIEVIVALAVTMIILTALTVAIVTSLGNVRRSETQNKSSQFVLEGMEIMRRMRDADYTTFFSLEGSYCLASSCSAVTTANGACGPKIDSCTENVDDFYIREVTIAQDSTTCNSSAPETKVTVRLTWTDTSCKDDNNPYCHESVLESCLSHFSTRLAP